MSDFNTAIIEEFRANEGKVGGPFQGAPMVLITTTGAKSGQQRVTPLVYLPDGDRIVIIASYAGAPKNPSWYHNIKANPTVTVEVGADKFATTAEELSGEERDRLYAAQVAVMPVFQQYADKAGRIIPVIALTRKP